MIVFKLASYNSLVTNLVLENCKILSKVLLYVSNLKKYAKA